MKVIPYHTQLTTQLSETYERMLRVSQAPFWDAELVMFAAEQKRALLRRDLVQWGKGAVPCQK